MAPYQSRGRRLSKWSISFSFLMALVIMLTACGGTSENTKNNNGNKKAVLTIVDSPKGDFTKNFNPFIDPQTSRYGTQGFVYETLVYYNRMTGEITPWLATYKLADDLKSVTFTPKPGVKWTDGQPFTAKDIVFTLNLMKDNPALDRGGIWNTLLKEVALSDDGNSAVVTLKEASSTVMWYVGGQVFIVPEHIWSKVSDPVKETNDNPVGTGPFKLKSFSSQLFTYEKNADYWQAGKPQVDEIRLPAVASNTSAILQLSNSDLDWTGIGYDPKYKAQFEDKDPEHNKTYFPASNVVMLYPNLTNPLLKELAVRQAISLGIDRAELTEKASPYAPPASPTALLLPANDKYVADEYKGLEFKQDIAKAKSTLEAAGYKQGSDGIYAKDGKKLSFKLNVVNGWSDWQSDVDLIKTQLKNVGIEIIPNALADFTPYFTAQQNGDYDISISWTSPGPTPYYLYYLLLHSSQSAPIGKPAANNWERWENPETDAILKQYATSADEATQMDAIHKLQKIMVEQLPTIPLTNNPYWDEYRTTRFTGWPDANNPYAAPSPTNYPDNEYIVLQLKPV